MILLFLSVGFSQGADAVLKIEKDVDSRAKIKIFASNKTYKQELASKLFKSDFKVSGHFLVENNISIVDFNILPINLKSSSEYNLVYELKRAGEGAFLDVKLYRGNPKKLVLRKNYNVTRLEKAPFLIHKAVSDINNYAKFQPIDWINRYVVLARYIGPRESEIMLADYSFTYKKSIIKGGLNLFVKWADNKQQELFYSDYSNKDNLKLIKYNIYTGKKEVVLKAKGMLACSDVSKDGSKLLLTMAPKTEADIFLYDSNGLKQLTTFSGIDVSGKFADNEENIVFVSNRLGTPNIFKMSINGGAVKNIVFHGKNNGSCDANGHQVVYSSKEERGVFNIYLTDSDGTQTRPLTSGGVNQFPRFSYDGNVVMYIKRTREGNSIGFINISANKSELFNMGVNKIQSIDW